MDLLKQVKKNNKNDLNSLLKVVVAFGGVFSFAVAIQYFFKVPILTTVIVLAIVIVLIYIINFLTTVKDYIVDYLRFEKRIKKLEKEIAKLQEHKK